MSSNMKKFLAVGAFILALLTFVMTGMNFFGVEAKGIFEKDLNEDNLLKYEQYDKNLLDDETDKGMHIKWNDDGSFALYGKHSDEKLSNDAFVEYRFTQVQLAVGQYTLSANNKDADDDTFGLYVKCGASEAIYTDNGVCNFQVTDENAPVEIGWYVKNNHRIVYEKIEPTLVAGSTAIEFYK